MAELLKEGTEIAERRGEVEAACPRMAAEKFALSLPYWQVGRYIIIRQSGGVKPSMYQMKKCNQLVKIF